MLCELYELLAISSSKNKAFIDVLNKLTDFINEESKRGRVLSMRFAYFESWMFMNYRVEETKILEEQVMK